MPVFDYTAYQARMAAPPTTPVLFDRAMLRTRQARALRLGAENFLLQRVSNELMERLAVVRRYFANAIDLDTPSEGLREALQSKVAGIRTVSIGDDDSAPLDFAPASADLAVSALGLQFVNDLPGVLTQLRLGLKPDGLLLAAILGGDTLTELRQAFAAAESEIEGGVSPRVAPMIDLRDAGALLQRAGFALPVCDVERIVVRYDDAFALMRDLRRMGATNILVERRRTLTHRATLLRMAQVYAERFTDPDARIRATFEVIWLSGWAPHESQPKPLSPNLARAIRR